MAVLHHLILLSSLISLGYALTAEITVKNNCGFNVFVKNQRANIGNFNLGPGQTRRWNVQGTTEAEKYQPKPRVWGQKGCDGSGNNCEVSDNNLSLAEFMFQDYGDAQFRGFTWYDISMVDGYNLPMTMSPYTTSDNGGNCYRVSCNFDLNQCPGESKLMKNGRIVGCKNLNRDAVTNYSNAIKRYCPKVYSWSKDDPAGQRACRQGNGGLTIQFC